MSFNGSNQYVDAGNAASLRVELGSFTIEVWIKPSSNIALNERFTILAFGGPGILGGFMDLPDDNGVEGYRFWNFPGGYKYIPPGNLISLDWTHFVVGWNKPATTLTIYINGVAKQSWTLASVDTSTEPLKIGKRTEGMYFNGSIDEVRIYSQALTAMEIQKHYAEGLGKHQVIVKSSKCKVKSCSY